MLCGCVDFCDTKFIQHPLSCHLLTSNRAIARLAHRLNGEGERQEIFSGSVWVGNDATNNEAEYCGLLEGLRAAKDLGIKVKR